MWRINLSSENERLAEDVFFDSLFCEGEKAAVEQILNFCENVDPRKSVPFNVLITYPDTRVGMDFLTYLRNCIDRKLSARNPKLVDADKLIFDLRECGELREKSKILYLFDASTTFVAEDWNLIYEWIQQTPEILKFFFVNKGITDELRKNEDLFYRKLSNAEHIRLEDYGPENMYENVLRRLQKEK